MRKILTIFALTGTCLLLISAQRGKVMFPPEQIDNSATPTALRSSALLAQVSQVAMFPGKINNENRTLPELSSANLINRQTGDVATRTQAETDAEAKRRADQLLGQMTLEEKLDLLHGTLEGS